nr:hypothetical protein [Saccharofermentans sp.]
FKKNYISIIRRSKERDPKVIESAKKDFLPERYIDDYLKIADNIDEGSIVNIIDTVMSGFEFAKYPDDMRILFMHGTKGNEAISRKAALKMRQVNPQTEIKEFKGMAHGELAIRNSDMWIREVNGFLGKRSS